MNHHHIQDQRQRARGLQYAVRQLTYCVGLLKRRRDLAQVDLDEMAARLNEANDDLRAIEEGRS